MYKTQNLYSHFLPEAASFAGHLRAWPVNLLESPVWLGKYCTKHSQGRWQVTPAYQWSEVLSEAFGSLLCEVHFIRHMVIQSYLELDSNEWKSEVSLTLYYEFWRSKNWLQEESCPLCYELPLWLCRMERKGALSFACLRFLSQEGNIVPDPV